MSDRGHPYRSLVVVVLGLWMGWQGIVNLARWTTIAGNLRTLGSVLNQSEAQFRTELLDATRHADVRRSDIHVSGFAQSVVTVDSRWTIEVPGVRTFEWPLVHRYDVTRRVASR